MRYKTRETAFVGSSSDGLDDPMSPPIAINLYRYNSVDGRSRLIVRASLKLILKHVLGLVIQWTLSPRDPHAAFNAPLI